MAHLTHTAVGTWSGGHHMSYGLPLEEERLLALLRPGDGIGTVITADAYGAGAADALLGRALEGVPRGEYALVGAIGHDFYEGERDGPRGYPRFTDARLRGPDGYRDYVRMAVERSWSAAASTPSTCCCCTTRTAPASRRPRSGRRSPRCGPRA